MKNTELSTLLKSAIKVRRKLIRSDRSRANFGDILAKVEYWVYSSADIEKTALKRRSEILVILPPNFVGKFNRIMQDIEPSC